MSDLAQAIVDLGKAAEDRRHARQDLAEATQVVADAIAKQLRTGDQIAVKVGGPAGVARYATYLVSWQIGPSSYSSPVAALCRNGAVLGRPDERSSGYRNVIADTTVVHVPSAEERATFALEVPQVVASFTELLENQARKFQHGAQIITQLGVRGPDVPRTGKWRNAPRDPYVADVVFHPSVSPNTVARLAQHFEVPVVETTGGKVVRFKLLARDVPSAQAQATNLVTEALNTTSGWRIEVHGPSVG